MTLYFVTGNKNKFKEAVEVIPNLEQLDVELPEIQDMDPHRVIKAKLQAAFDHHEGEFIVEDVSLHIECLNGFPGPFVKFFMETVTNEKVVEIVQKLGNDRVEIKTIIGYAKSKEDIIFFEDVVKARIVPPKGENGWGFDPIILSDDLDKTFGELTYEEKAEVSHRGIVLNKLKEYLKQ